MLPQNARQRPRVTPLATSTLSQPKDGNLHYNAIASQWALPCLHDLSFNTGGTTYHFTARLCAFYGVIYMVYKHEDHGKMWQIFFIQQRWKFNGVSPTRVTYSAWSQMFQLTFHKLWDFGFRKVPIYFSKIYLTLRYKLRHFHGLRSYGNKSLLMNSREFSQLLYSDNNKLTLAT